MLLEELKEFILFFWEYLINRVHNFGANFEKIKDLIVALLIVKRGKYSTSFLNTSFLLLVATAIIGGPVIVDNNPFISSFAQSFSDKEQAVVSYNPYQSSLGTIVSAKPRDKVINYTVRSGDVLGSISKKFNISIDSIKWINNLKTKIIKPNQVLKIPPITGVVHTVKSGESIYTIAKKFKTDPQKIVNFPFNDFVDIDTFSLRAGQILYVPDGVIEEAKPKLKRPRYLATIKAGVKGTSNFIWPTSGRITQRPIWYHMAVDIANRSAPNIIASDTGTVVYSGCLRYGYGCHIVVDHGNGYRTLYGHLSRLSVSSGQSVSQGQVIGRMGSTGRSTGTHLHFEIRSGGKLLNPLSFLK